MKYMSLRVAMPEPHSSRAEYNERSTHWYVESLRSAGLETVVIPAATDSADALRMLGDCKGVLLPGSPADVPPQKYGEEKLRETNTADPLRDNLDELLIQDAYNLYKPLLAICYGLQNLNVWRTGTLIQHLPIQPVNHESGSKVLQAHEIEIEPGSKLERLAGSNRQWVNSSHHQALQRVGDGLRVTAWSVPDRIIEAVEGINQEHWVVGVQWHPERTYGSEPLSLALFSEFARAVQEWRPRRVTESVLSLC